MASARVRRSWPRHASAGNDDGDGDDDDDDDKQRLQSSGGGSDGTRRDRGDDVSATRRSTRSNESLRRRGGGSGDDDGGGGGGRCSQSTIVLYAHIRRLAVAVACRSSSLGRLRRRGAAAPRRPRAWITIVDARRIKKNALAAVAERVVSRFCHRRRPLPTSSRHSSNQ